MDGAMMWIGLWIGIAFAIWAILIVTAEEGDKQ